MAAYRNMARRSPNERKPPVRTLLIVLACLLPGLSAAEDKSDRLCKSLNLQPGPCYAGWVPNLLNLVNVGVSVAAEQKREFNGEAGMKQENDLYAYAMKGFKPGSEKAAALNKAHAYAQESLRAIVERKGLTEADRKKEVHKRQAELTKLVEPLSR
jgi:hypothetical protein